MNRLQYSSMVPVWSSMASSPRRLSPDEVPGLFAVRAPWWWLNERTGRSNAKDWEALAKTEKLEILEHGVALELAKLETAVEAIHGNLLYLISK
ncbi:hypothetical protein GUJ93_ZPchr0008g13051 [Zizania palustris]|uniref:Uncharacterized protein n=1 Tax=Zizania palustris TaxID=103762 RepID=A0A8J5RCJ7_ZIZPA|nr:hypothetical protein GUJ93_ZPchr0008g13051 [Zizania palustris]